MRRTLLVGVAAIAAWAGCGDSGADDTDTRRPVIEDPGPVHVHGLGINPRDQALFIATHTGLFRIAAGDQQPRRVADRYQDTMGFTVVGPDRFLGSGHPDASENLPAFLGLIRSRDAGHTWQEVSLLGEADFHVLEAHGQTVYGFGADFQTRRERFLVSTNGGRTWRQRRVPERLQSLAIAPDDTQRVVAAGARRLHASDDGGRTWRPLGRPGGLLAWPVVDRLYRLTADGAVDASQDAGARWHRVGDLGGQPAAFEAAGRRLYAALHDGTVKWSEDGGFTWGVRARP